MATDPSSKYWPLPTLMMHAYRQSNCQACDLAPLQRPWVGRRSIIARLMTACWRRLNQWIRSGPKVVRSESLSKHIDSSGGQSR
jgi:hypothetical protein